MNKLKLKLSKLLVLGLIIFYSSLNAQINLQFNAINEYGFNSKQALNLTIVNSNPKSFDVILTGYIKDVNNQTVVEFKSNPYTLTTGANIITPMNLGFTELNYSNSDILEIETKTGNYPSGNYTICIWSACATADCSGAGANAGSIETPVCTSIQVENPTPLILVTPENESEIEETRPLFFWIPPAPVAGSDMLNYTLILVEMLEGQNKADALTMNRPLIEMEGISNPSLMFPSDLPELEKDKWYAWQVQAYVGKTPLAKSEQWKFKVKKDTIDLKKIPKEQSYIEISGQTGESVFYGVGVLKLRHVVRLETGKINLSIKDKNNKEVKLENNVFTINPGDNRMDLNLEEALVFKHGQTYTLTGNLLNGESFLIKFIYIDPKLIK